MTDELMAQADKPIVDPTKKTFFETLAGPGGKFHDPDPNVAMEKISRGKMESDAYIKSLEARLDEMRADFLQMKEENDSRANLEELIDQLSTTRNTDTRITPQPQEVSKPTIDYTQIAGFVERQLKAQKAADQQEANWNVVKAKLVERYGENWDAHVTKTVADLGMSNEDATTMAKKSPQAFLRTLGLDQAQSVETFQTPPRPQSIRSTFTPSTTPERNWAYYEKLRVEKPKEYYDQKTQVQLHKDAIALGDKFGA